jgi:hypothetical protein
LDPLATGVLQVQLVGLVQLAQLVGLVQLAQLDVLAFKETFLKQLLLYRFY